MLEIWEGMAPLPPWLRLWHYRANVK